MSVADFYNLNDAGRQRVRDESAVLDFDFRRAHATLQERIGEVATGLLGRPNGEMSTRDQLRFGSNGSIAVEIGGPRAGTYFNHEHKRGGGVRELLEFEGGIKRGQDQIAWLRDKIGFETPLAMKPQTALSESGDDLRSGGHFTALYRFAWNRDTGLVG